MKNDELIDKETGEILDEEIASDVDEEFSFEASKERPQIPPGEYEAICKKAGTGYSTGGEKKLYLTFVIQGGDCHGTELFMAITKPKKKITPRFKMHEQWCLAMRRVPKKGERIAAKHFIRKMYSVMVRDTKVKYKDGRPKPDFMQYSVVDTIIEPLVGVPSPEVAN